MDESGEVRILVTGERRALLPARLPDGRPLKWQQLPLMAFEPIPISREQLEGALTEREAWLCFTSPRGVGFLSGLCERHGVPWEHHRKAAVGKGTARALRERGHRVDFVPSRPGSETFLAEFPGEPSALSPAKVCLLAPQGGRTLIERTLRDRGYEVNRLEIYRRRGRKDLSSAEREWEQAAHWYLFTSPSSVEEFCRFFPLPEPSRIVAIGTYTQAELRRRGREAALLPDGDFERIGEVIR